MPPKVQGELIFVWMGDNGAGVSVPKVKDAIARGLGFSAGELNGYVILNLDYGRVTSLYTNNVYRLVPSVGATE